MSQDPPIPRQDNGSDQEIRSDGVATVEWGEAERSPRGRAPRWLTGFGHDHRLVPVVAGLGVAAVIASLVGEWTTTTVPNAGPDGSAVRLPAGVGDIATFGAGYLVGLLGLVGSVALVLFGTPTIRHNARVLGLALAGGLLVLLVAATASLEETTERLLFGPDDGLAIEYGRGLTMAYVGTAVLGLALLLAGRFVRPPGPPSAAARPGGSASDRDAGQVGGGAGPAGVTPTDVTPTDGAQDGDRGAADRAGWPWHRSATPRAERRGSDREDELPAPSDLTVGPVAPFAHPEQQDGR